MLNDRSRTNRLWIQLLTNTKYHPGKKIKWINRKMKLLTRSTIQRNFIFRPVKAIHHMQSTPKHSKSLQIPKYIASISRKKANCGWNIFNSKRDRQWNYTPLEWSDFVNWLSRTVIVVLNFDHSFWSSNAWMRGWLTASTLELLSADKGLPRNLSIFCAP